MSVRNGTGLIYIMLKYLPLCFECLQSLGFRISSFAQDNFVFISFIMYARYLNVKSILLHRYVPYNWGVRSFVTLCFSLESFSNQIKLQSEDTKVEREILHSTQFCKPGLCVLFHIQAGILNKISFFELLPYIYIYSNTVLTCFSKYKAINLV